MVNQNIIEKKRIDQVLTFFVLINLILLFSLIHFYVYKENLSFTISLIFCLLLAGFILVTLIILDYLLIIHKRQFSKVFTLTTFTILYLTVALLLTFLTNIYYLLQIIICIFLAGIMYFQIAKINNEIEIITIINPSKVYSLNKDSSKDISIKLQEAKYTLMIFLEIIFCFINSIIFGFAFSNQIIENGDQFALLTISFVIFLAFIPLPFMIYKRTKRINYEKAWINLILPIIFFATSFIVCINFHEKTIFYELIYVVILTYYFAFFTKLFFTKYTLKNNFYR